MTSKSTPDLPILTPRDLRYVAGAYGNDMTRTVLLRAADKIERLEKEIVDMEERHGDAIEALMRGYD